MYYRDMIELGIWKKMTAAATRREQICKFLCKIRLNSRGFNLKVCDADTYEKETLGI